MTLFLVFYAHSHHCCLKLQEQSQVRKTLKLYIKGWIKILDAMYNPNVTTYTREEMAENKSFLMSSAIITYSRKGQVKEIEAEFKVAHVM